MLGDMLKPVLRPLLEAHAKATGRPAKAPMTKTQALARIELLRREDLPPLTASMERFIEGANLDAELSGLP